jgi:hypothetical protein
MNQAGNGLEIFKAGRHVAANGQTYEFSEADVLATAKAYNPTLHAAPLVVGHPAMDDPAYGWTQSLAFSEQKLLAFPVDVDPAFAELVNAKRYANISASFYAPNSPVNPVPGVYYLRHVGFLGAHPPAVQGLKSPSFASGESLRDIISIDFSEAWSLPGQGNDVDIALRARMYKDKMEGLNIHLSFAEAVDAVTSGEDRIEFGQAVPNNMSDRDIARRANAYMQEMASKGHHISVAKAVDTVTGRW